MASRMQKNPLPILDPNRPSSSLSITSPAAVAAHRKNASIATTATGGSGSALGQNGQAGGAGLLDDAMTDGTGSPGIVAANPTGKDSSEPESTPWTGIDLGGIRLKTLTPALFAFNHITALYINHNHLASLSPAISQLRALVHLDATGNQLVSLPAEIGLLASLKELLVFDNNLGDLPLELGTLHQLDFLGIDGNPLPEAVRSVMSEKGTRGLVAYFRDNAPVPPQPPVRQWENADEADDVLDGEEGDEERTRMEQEAFSALSYNILCQRYATGQTYGYTPSWALEWSYRRDLILNDVTGPGTDFLCLQVRSARGTGA